MSVFTINNFKYLVVHSGFTGRLIDRIEELNNLIFEEVYLEGTDNDYEIRSTLFIKDEIYGEGLHKFGHDGDIDDILNHLKMIGCKNLGLIAFRCSCLMHALEMIKVLKKMNYCKSFRVEGITEMVFVGKTTLIVDIDCESG